MQDIKSTEEVLESLEERPQEEDQNPYSISSKKFTNPTIKDELRTLYKTLEEFYLISHRIKNPLEEKKKCQ
tara:strand:- start:368 stop:580 length:213 start_codon:yes stop_codon:yes gene_type:complete